MLQLESRTCTARGSQEDVFAFVSDFRKLGKALPEEFMKDVETRESECSFAFSGLGRIGLRIADKAPHSLVTISGTEDAPARFTLRISLSPVSDQETQLKFAMEAGLNMMLEMMARKPLQDFPGEV